MSRSAPLSWWLNPPVLVRCVTAALSVTALMAARWTGVAAQIPVQTPRTIRVVVDNNYPPFAFQSNEGVLQGILIDQWRAWETKTGIKAEIPAWNREP